MMRTDSATPDTAQDAVASGRAQVRTLLIEPLDVAGLKRPRGVTEDTQRSRLAQLAERLAYLTPENLVTLRDVIQTHAASPSGGQAWPTPVVIESWAQGLQARPVRESDIMRSWLASVEGPPALASGHHVQLFRLLRRRMVPPSDYEKRLIREEADRDRRHKAVCEERVQNGTASADERGWLEAYARDDATVRVIIADGEARRAARVREAAEAAQQQGEQTSEGEAA
jgi:hypothetical protein